MLTRCRSERVVVSSRRERTTSSSLNAASIIAFTRASFVVERQPLRHNLTFSHCTLLTGEVETGRDTLTRLALLTVGLDCSCCLQRKNLDPSCGESVDNIAWNYEPSEGTGSHDDDLCMALDGPDKIGKIKTVSLLPLPRRENFFSQYDQIAAVAGPVCCDLPEPILRKDDHTPS